MEPLPAHGNLSKRMKFWKSEGILSTLYKTIVLSKIERQELGLG